MKYTEGPWKLTEWEEDAGCQRLFAGSTYLGSVYNSDMEPEQIKANARLIAAAPDMLAMLEELEWAAFLPGPGCYKVCPKCGQGDGDGHTADCKLGNLLKRIKGDK